MAIFNSYVTNYQRVFSGSASPGVQPGPWLWLRRLDDVTIRQPRGFSAPPTDCMESANGVTIRDEKQLYIYIYGWWFGKHFLFSPIVGMMI